MPMTGTYTSARRIGGFSLIEVLVSMIVLAIGLLGLASLQARSLKFNQDAYIRSQATTLAYDITDRMRADRANASQYVMTANDFATIAGNLASGNTTCNPTSIAPSGELVCWVDNLRSALPGAAATIAQNTSNANYYDVTLSWYDRESGTTKSQTWVIWP